ncbi:DUF4377 domain-containing protein [Stenotrophomonas sp. ATCM1_4]|uniref:META and DUF4377 domain-containing protein n=1 Tax=Stenotrophomonas sp. ATCM1_4 TaxID=2259330 RepID=UPI0010535116|nr:META and DUF4377 domain-containing protein [Stenotrophomonas sp. ATCM1_4]TDB26290.1 DUF4377 domain-containing protein [Stenotrophomonas sp. ATCM1_4]
MKRILMLALPLALMAACSNPSQTTTKSEATPAANTATPAAAASIDATQLGANHWLLDTAVDSAGKRVDALFVRADKPVTLDFKDGRLSVSNACNGMGGGYTLEGDALSVGNMMSTNMACGEPGVMALDGLVSERLQGKLTIRSLDASQLVLAAANGDVLTFRAEPTAEARYGGEGERVFLEVDAQTKPCTHGVMRDAQCLQVREVKYNEQGLEQGKRGEWENFYGNIEGYTHQPGVRNVLRLKRFQVKNPPADASSLAYVLDMVISSEQVGK